MVYKFHIIKASGDNYSIGYEIGRKLKKVMKNITNKKIIDVKNYKTKTKSFLKYTKQTYPELINELKGLSDGSDLPFELVFAFNCREAFVQKNERCTTFIDPKKRLIAHNEDWDGNIENLYILKAKINKLKILSLNYALELSGTSVAITSNSLVQTINDLSSNDTQIGVPKNFIARRILEKKSINEIKNTLNNTKRASGFNHIIWTSEGFFNIESTAKKYILQKIDKKFVHTNHYLTSLSNFESTKSISTRDRLKRAREIIGSKNMKQILSDRKCYPNSILSKRTLASIIIKDTEIQIKPNIKKENYSKYKTTFL